MWSPSLDVFLHIFVSFLSGAILAITSGPTQMNSLPTPLRFLIFSPYPKPLIVESTNRVAPRNSQVRKPHLWALATTPAGLSAFVPMNNLSLPCDPLSLSTDPKC